MDDWLAGLFIGLILGGWCIFGVLLVVGFRTEGFYRDQHICQYEGGTYHNGDDLCIKDGRVLHLKKRDN